MRPRTLEGRACAGRPTDLKLRDERDRLHVRDEDGDGGRSLCRALGPCVAIGICAEEAKKNSMSDAVAR